MALDKDCHSLKITSLRPWPLVTLTAKYKVTTFVNVDNNFGTSHHHNTTYNKLAKATLVLNLAVV